MFLRAVKAVSVALFFYILYYICQIVSVFALADSDAVTMTVVGSVVFAVAVWVLFLIFRRNLKDAVKLTPISVSEATFLLFLGVAFNVLVTFVMAVLPIPESMLDSYVEASSLITESSVFMNAALTLVIAPLVEELLFRGLIYGGFRKAFPIPVAVVVSALLFGLGHGVLLWVIYAAVFGAVLALIFERYKSLTASMAFHFGFNAVGFIGGMFEGFGLALLVLLVPSAIFAVVGMTRIFRLSQ